MIAALPETAARPRPAVDPDQSKGWLQRVLPVVRAHRLSFAVALAASLLGIFARVVLARYTGYAVNEALARPAELRLPLTRYIVVLAVLSVAAFVAGGLARYFLFRTAYALEFDLRALLYEHLTRLPFSFYDRQQSGQLVSRANSDVRSVQMFLAFAPFILLQFATVLLALWYMVRIDLGLTVAVLATLPAVFFLGLRMRRLMFPLSWIVQARMADIATIVDENIQGVRVVKGFAAEHLQIAGLARAAERLRWASVVSLRVRATFGPLMENLPRFGEVAILLYGGLLVIDGRVGPGEIVVFMAYLAMLQAPFRMLGFLIMMHQRASASARRIYEVLDEPPEPERPGAVDLVSCQGELEFRDVHFAYPGGPPVLRGVDLHIPARQTVAVVGRTGCGKTTLAHLVLRFYDVDEGAVLLDGNDVRSLTLRSLRTHVGMCFDEPFLFSASIRDNIAYGRPDATFDDIVAAARIAGADEFIVNLEHGYDTVVGERGYTLSGGQRQRIAIARAILDDTTVLVLDDATSALDVKVELQIHEGLGSLLRNRTTFIVAHRLSTIGLADRVVLLDEGRIVADGTHAELLATEPRYAELLVHMSEEDAAKAAHVEAATPSAPVDVDFDVPLGIDRGGI